MLTKFEQLKSLTYLLYKDTPLAHKPTATEISQTILKVQKAMPHEASLLKKLYQENQELWAYATRDTDGDGILDYRISDYAGKILEGDVDIDGDGIRNIYDVAPYDAQLGGIDSDGDGAPDVPGSFEDKNNNGIPDHIDWRAQGKDPKLAAIQESLFKNRKIILAERREEFPLKLAEATYDNIYRVFKKIFEDRDQLETLRTIVTDRYLLLNKSVDDGTEAMEMSQVQTMIFLKSGLKFTPLQMLGFFAHEFAHHYQFSLDFSKEDQENFRKNLYKAPNLMKLVEKLGWNVKTIDLDPNTFFQLFIPAFREFVPYQLSYGGRSSEEWKLLIKKLGDDYMNNSEMKTHHVVGAYSLTDPWEFQAEYMTASLFIRMEDYAKNHFCNAADYKKLIAAFKADLLKDWGNQFYHGNARGNPILAIYAETFPISDPDLRFLTKKYLLGEYPTICK